LRRVAGFRRRPDVRLVHRRSLTRVAVTGRASAARRR
jgi:hypothetical protein